MDEFKGDINDSQEVMKKLRSDLEDKVETIIKQQSTFFQDQMSLTLTNQLASSNAEISKCIKYISSMVGHLSSKVDANGNKLNQFCKKRKRTIKEGESDKAFDSSDGSTTLVFDDRRCHQDVERD